MTFACLLREEVLFPPYLCQQEASVYMPNFFLDYILKSLRCGGSSYKQLWRCTTIKDAIVSLLLANAITITHVGMLNTCLCALVLFSAMNQNSASYFHQEQHYIEQYNNVCAL